MNNISENNTTVCSIFKDGLSDGFLAIQHVILICISILPIIINSAALYYLVKNKLLENSTKLLLGTLFLFNVLFSSAVIMNSFRILLAYSREPCRLILPYNDCEKINLIFLAPVVGIHCTMLAIAIQRLNASIFHSYRISRNGLLSAVLLIIEALVIILLLIEVNYLDVNSVDRPCDSFAVRVSDSSIYKAMITILMEKIAMIIFIYLHFSNRKKYVLTINQAINRLKIRYQLMLNIQLNRALLPSAFICFPGFLLTDLLVMTLSQKSYRDRAFQSNLTFLVSILCCTLQPLTFFARNKWFRDPLRKDLLSIFAFRWCRTINRVSDRQTKAYVKDGHENAAEMVTNKYFEDLASAWN